MRTYIALALTAPAFVFCWFLATFVKRLPAPLVRLLARRHSHYTARRPFDLRVPLDPSIPPYLFRWWRIPRNAIFNIYYHVLESSDDDRALHDHPWWSFSLVLSGGYLEERIREGGIREKTWSASGMMTFRWTGRKAHRLELVSVATPARTIFITGPVTRRWGFHDPIHGWVDAYHWDQHCKHYGIKAMPMLRGSYGIQSPRNKHRNTVTP